MKKKPASKKEKIDHDSGDEEFECAMVCAMVHCKRLITFLKEAVRVADESTEGIDLASKCDALALGISEACEEIIDNLEYNADYYRHKKGLENRFGWQIDNKEEPDAQELGNIPLTGSAKSDRT